MKVTKAYKVALNPNNKQRTHLLKHAGAARWAYNWGLARRKELYAELGESTNAIALHRELNVLKKSEVPWMYEVSKAAPQEALRDLDRAYKNFFDGLKGKRPKVGFPRFKSKKRGMGRFRLTGTIKIFDKHIQLPRLGVLRLKERNYIPVEGVKILSATISERAGRWFVSVAVEEEVPDPPAPTGEPVGIDLGIEYLAYTSDGEAFDNPRALKAKTKQLVRWQRRLSRRQKGSKNRDKARRMVAKLHYQITCIRKDARDKMAANVVSKQPQAIVVETLNVSGMLKNRCLAKSLLDASIRAARSRIKVKASENRIPVVEADRFYPSSKLCSECGAYNGNLQLSDRTYRCTECGSVKPRDFNAACNLKNLVPQVLREFTPVETV